MTGRRVQTDNSSVTMRQTRNSCSRRSTANGDLAESYCRLQLSLELIKEASLVRCERPIRLTGAEALKVVVRIRLSICPIAFPPGVLNAAGFSGKLKCSFHFYSNNLPRISGEDSLRPGTGTQTKCLIKTVFGDSDDRPL